MTTEQLYYTGVGARVTPEHILMDMRDIAVKLRQKNICLRSGGQELGADNAFESAAGGKKQIFLPTHWRSSSYHGHRFEILPEAYDIAARHHPVWNALPVNVKNLMARNVHAVLGPDLKSPSDFFICWTADGCYTDKKRTRATGGTGHAISVADEAAIPIFNLNFPMHYDYVLYQLVKP